MVRPLVSLRLDELVARLGGELIGNPAVTVSRVSSVERAEEGDLAFVSDRKYLAKLKDCRASVVVVAPDAKDAVDRPRIVTHDPYLYFARAAQLLNPPRRPDAGVHPSATVGSAIPSSVSVGAGAVIEQDVQLGEDVVIGAGCYVGAGVSIGAGTRLHPRVSIYEDCVIGKHCLIHSGAVIGADGFGFAREADGRWVKIPQVGKVVIGDDVEIGANTTVDRGALDDTVIHDNVKIDNLVQVAHNVHIGESTAIAGCVGIAGSTHIGARCMLAGQVGVIGHLKIADDVVISAGTKLTKAITRPGMYTASLPVQSHADWVKNFSHLRHLDALVERVRALEKRLEPPEKP